MNSANACKCQLVVDSDGSTNVGIYSVGNGGLRRFVLHLDWVDPFLVSMALEQRLYDDPSGVGRWSDK